MATRELEGIVDEYLEGEGGRKEEINEQAYT
jgi:hypothetical protein